MIDLAKHEFRKPETAKKSGPDIHPLARRAARAATSALNPDELATLNVIAERFAQGRPSTVNEVRDALKVPDWIAQSMVRSLSLKHAIVREMYDGNPSERYIPARAFDEL